MPNFNKVILAGNLTRDPDLKYLPSGTAVAEFGLAINRSFKGKDGAKRDETAFIDIKAWGRQAEVVNQYLSKGRPVLIEGRLEQSRWETKDGQKRSKIRVVLERFEFLESRGRGEGGGGRKSGPSDDGEPPMEDPGQFQMDQDPSGDPPF